MPRSAGILTFPDFSGFTRKLILWNLGAYFALLLLGVASGHSAFLLYCLDCVVSAGCVPWIHLAARYLQLCPSGDSEYVAFELLSLWFLGSFLEAMHGSRWMAEIYFVSVVGAGLAALALYAAMPSSTWVHSQAARAASSGC